MLEVPPAEVEILCEVLLLLIPYGLPGVLWRRVRHTTDMLGRRDVSHPPNAQFGDSLDDSEGFFLSSHDRFMTGRFENAHLCGTTAGPPRHPSILTLGVADDADVECVIINRQPVRF